MEPAEASSLINPFDPSFWRDPYSHYPCLLAGPPRLLPLVPIQNLNPDVLMVDTAEDRYRCDAAELLRPPKIRSIFIQ
jgi:hypothetical protein